MKRDRARPRGEHADARRPPRHPAVAQRKFLARFLTPREIEPDGRDQEEVGHDDEVIDPRQAPHVARDRHLAPGHRVRPRAIGGAAQHQQACRGKFRPAAASRGRAPGRTRTRLLVITSKSSGRFAFAAVSVGGTRTGGPARRSVRRPAGRAPGPSARPAPPPAATGTSAMRRQPVCIGGFERRRTVNPGLGGRTRHARSLARRPEPPRRRTGRTARTAPPPREKARPAPGNAPACRQAAPGVSQRQCPEGVFHLRRFEGRRAAENVEQSSRSPPRRARDRLGQRREFASADLPVLTPMSTHPVRRLPVDEPARTNHRLAPRRARRPRRHGNA